MRMLQEKRGGKRFLGEIADPFSSFAPFDLDNMVFWLDASDPATITDAGAGAVSEWRDKSGNGYHVTEGTNRPTTGTRTINGLNTLDFDGTNDRLSKTTGIRGESIYAYYAAVELDVVNVTQYMTAWGIGGTTRTSHFYCINTAIQAFFSHTASAAGSSSVTVAAATPLLYCCLVRRGWRDGVTATTSSPIAVCRAGGAWGTPQDLGIPAAAATMHVGHQNGANFFNGKIGEILALSICPGVKQDLAIRNYFAKKWGVTA